MTWKDWAFVEPFHSRFIIYICETVFCYGIPHVNWNRQKSTTASRMEWIHTRAPLKMNQNIHNENFHHILFLSTPFSCLGTILCVDARYFVICNEKKNCFDIFFYSNSWRVEKISFFSIISKLNNNLFLTKPRKSYRRQNGWINSIEYWKKSRRTLPWCTTTNNWPWFCFFDVENVTSLELPLYTVLLVKIGYVRFMNYRVSRGLYSTV